MKGFTACLLVFFMSLGSLAGNCAPDLMLHAVTVARRPFVHSGPFAGQPKALYRIGNKYGRVEEAKNPNDGLHLLIVVSEPDVWVVNRTDMSGQHMVDRGPTLDFRAPVIANFKSSRWNGFEFGCEESFMKSVGAKAMVDSSGNLNYTHEADGRKVTLHLSRDHYPLLAEISMPEGGYAIQYLTYEWLESDLRLFTRPVNVRYVERK
jgi:hypothetical protein